MNNVNFENFESIISFPTADINTTHQKFYVLFILANESIHSDSQVLVSIIRESVAWVFRVWTPPS